MSSRRTRVVGWGIFPLPGERARRRANEAKAAEWVRRVDLDATSAEPEDSHQEARERFENAGATALEEARIGFATSGDPAPSSASAGARKGPLPQTGARDRASEPGPRSQGEPPSAGQLQDTRRSSTVWMHDRELSEQRSAGSEPSSPWGSFTGTTALGALEALRSSLGRFPRAAQDVSRSQRDWPFQSELRHYAPHSLSEIYVIQDPSGHSAELARMRSGSTSFGVRHRYVIVLPNVSGREVTWMGRTDPPLFLSVDLLNDWPVFPSPE